MSERQPGKDTDRARTGAAALHAASDATPSGARRPEVIKAVPVRHPWRWVATLVVVALAGGVIYTFATAPGLQWGVVRHFLLASQILSGVGVTLELTAIAQVIGIVVGVVVAVMRLSPNRVVSSVSWFYVWFFRGTPTLVQIFFWFNIASILPYIRIGIPFTQLMWTGVTNQLVTPFMAAILGLGLAESAYMSEIVRAGIISVDAGQIDAAQALGMHRILVMRRIVLPQAMRVIIPPTGNEAIGMLKTSSLAYVATVGELFFVQKQISDFNYHIIELVVVATIWYLIMMSVLAFGQYYLERYFARGSSRELPQTPIQRFRKLVFQSNRHLRELDRDRLAKA